ncbi:MAG: hypothetical protein WAK86_12875 [Pseudonocardiaceae bacterium]
MDSLVIIVVLGAALATVAVYAVVGRVLPGRWRKGDVAESEGFAIESVNVLIGLLFSILLAFLIATVLSDYDKASSDAQGEANAIGAVHSLARAIPQPTQSLWKSDSKNYTTLVINQDWPLMQHQDASEPAWTALNKLRNDIFALQPANALEQTIQDKAIDKVQDIYDSRRTRVDLINAGIPEFMWYTLLVGAALVALFPLLTKPHPTGRLLIAVGIQGAVIAASLYLVAVLNHPFSGTFRVDPSAFQILLDRFNSSP